MSLIQFHSEFILKRLRMFNTCPLPMSLIASLYGCSKFTEISWETSSSRTGAWSWWAVWGPRIGRTRWKTVFVLRYALLLWTATRPRIFFPVDPSIKSLSRCGDGTSLCYQSEFHSQQEWIIWHNTGTGTGSDFWETFKKHCWKSCCCCCLLYVWLLKLEGGRMICWWR